MNNVILGGYVKIKTGKLDANASEENGKYPFFTCAREISRINTYAFDCECILVAGNGELNVKYYNGKFNAYQRTYVIESLDHQVLSTKYLYYFIDSYMAKLRNGAIGGVIKYIKLNHLTDIELPIPDLETQDKIVAVLDKVTSLIKKREKAIVFFDKLMRSSFLDIFGEPTQNAKGWERNLLGKYIIKIIAGSSYGGSEKAAIQDDELGVLKISSVTKGTFNPNEYKTVKKTIIKKKIVKPNKGDLLFSRANTMELVGATCIVDKDYDNLFLPDKLWKIELNEGVVKKTYLHFLLQSKNFKENFTKTATGSSGSMLNISMDKFRSLEIPIPPINKQREFEKIYNTVEGQRDKHIKFKNKLDMLLKSLSQQAFGGNIVYDIDIELEALINSIDIKLTDEENDISTIKNDITFLQRLLDKLNDQEYDDLQQYNKAKYIVFRILKEEENLIKQEFDANKKRIKLSV